MKLHETDLLLIHGVHGRLDHVCDALIKAGKIQALEKALEIVGNSEKLSSAMLRIRQIITGEDKWLSKQ